MLFKVASVILVFFAVSAHSRTFFDKEDFAPREHNYSRYFSADNAGTRACLLDLAKRHISMSQIPSAVIDELSFKVGICRIDRCVTAKFSASVNGTPLKGEMVAIINGLDSRQQPITCRLWERSVEEGDVLIPDAKPCMNPQSKDYLSIVDSRGNLVVNGCTR